MDVVVQQGTDSTLPNLEHRHTVGLCSCRNCDRTSYTKENLRGVFLNLNKYHSFRDIPGAEKLDGAPGLCADEK